MGSANRGDEWIVRIKRQGDPVLDLELIRRNLTGTAPDEDRLCETDCLNQLEVEYDGAINAPVNVGGAAGTGQFSRDVPLPGSDRKKSPRILRSPGCNLELGEDEREDEEPAFHGSFVCCFTGAPRFCPGLVPQRLHAGRWLKTNQAASRECRCAENSQVLREKASPKV